MTRSAAALLLAACFLAAPASAGTSPLARGTETEPLNKLYVIMAFDTNDEGLRASLEKDEQSLRKFWELFPGRCELTVLKGEDVTLQGLSKALKEVRKKATPKDGIVFYFGGHGAMIEKPPLKPYHVLRLSRKPVTDITRASLRNMLKTSRAGLAVILTDCCSTKERYDRKEEDPPFTKKDFLPVVEQLFFRSRGLVDITAATEEEAWSDDQNGGLFTRTLIRLLKKKPEELGAKKAEDVTWELFFPQLQRETQTFFKSWSAKMKARYPDVPIRAETQKPHAFFLNKLQAYSAVELENAKGEAITYEFRWEGEKDWRPLKVTLKPGQRLVHYHPVAPGKEAAKLEIRREGSSREHKLKAQLWNSDYAPRGLEYRYRIRK